MRNLWSRLTDWVLFRWYLTLDAFDALHEHPERPDLHTPHDRGFERDDRE